MSYIWWLTQVSKAEWECRNCDGELPSPDYPTPPSLYGVGQYSPLRDSNPQRKTHYNRITHSRLTHVEYGFSHMERMVDLVIVSNCTIRGFMYGHDKCLNHPNKVYEKMLYEEKLGHS